MTSGVVGVVELRAPLSTVTSEHDGRRLGVHQGPTLMHQPQVEQVVADMPYPKSNGGLAPSQEELADGEAQSIGPVDVARQAGSEVMHPPLIDLYRFPHPREKPGLHPNGEIVVDRAVWTDEDHTRLDPQDLELVGELLEDPFMSPFNEPFPYCQQSEVATIGQPPDVGVGGIDVVGIRPLHDLQNRVCQVGAAARIQDAVHCQSPWSSPNHINHPSRENEIVAHCARLLPVTLVGWQVVQLVSEHGQL